MGETEASATKEKEHLKGKQWDGWPRWETWSEMSLSYKEKLSLQTKES